MRQSPFQVDIIKAIEVLRNGGIILYPTDTIWGLGADATNCSAVEKIFSIKQRDKSKSLIIFIDNEDKLFDYVEEVPPLTWELLKYADSPLTIVFPKGKNVCSSILAEDGSIAIRIPKDDFSHNLVRSFGKPIISTSANFSGKMPPVNFLDIDEDLIKKVDYVVKWKQSDRNRAKPSKIIKLGYNNEFKIIRQ